MQIRVVVRETTISLMLVVKIIIMCIVLFCSQYLDGFPHEAVAGLVGAGEV